MTGEPHVDLGQGGLSPETWAALEAGRLVIIRRPERTMGLQDGVECYFVEDEEHAEVLLAAWRLDPGRFLPIQALGRLAAQRRAGR